MWSLKCDEIIRYQRCSWLRNRFVFHFDCQTVKTNSLKLMISQWKRPPVLHSSVCLSSLRCFACPCLDATTLDSVYSDPDVDEQLLFSIPLKGQVKLSGIQFDVKAESESKSIEASGMSSPAFSPRLSSVFLSREMCLIPTLIISFHKISFFWVYFPPTFLLVCSSKGYQNLY